MNLKKFNYLIASAALAAALSSCTEEDRAIFKTPAQERKAAKIPPSKQELPKASSGEIGVVRTKYQGTLKDAGELRAQLRKLETRIEMLDKEARTQIAILKHQTKGRMPELATTEKQLTETSKAFIRQLGKMDEMAADVENRAQSCIQKLQGGEQRVFASCSKGADPAGKQIQDLYKHAKDYQGKAESTYSATKQKLQVLSNNIARRQW